MENIRVQAVLACLVCWKKSENQLYPFKKASTKSRRLSLGFFLPVLSLRYDCRKTRAAILGILRICLCKPLIPWHRLLEFLPLRNPNKSNFFKTTRDSARARALSIAKALHQIQPPLIEAPMNPPEMCQLWGRLKKKSFQQIISFKLYKPPLSILKTKKELKPPKNLVKIPKSP